MDPQLKQRIVGAVVLISLAVIVIPILLDGDGRPGLLAGKSNVPARPSYQFDALELPLDVPDTGEKQRPSVNTVPPMVDPAGEKPVVKSTKVINERSPVLMAQGRTTEKSPPLSEANPSSGAWVVQMGSFGSEKNATALRDRLRKAGHSVHLETLAHNGERHYRVRLGAVAGREAAEKLQQRVAKELALKGVVMPEKP